MGWAPSLPCIYVVLCAKGHWWTHVSSTASSYCWWRKAFFVHEREGKRNLQNGLGPYERANSLDCCWGEFIGAIFKGPCRIDWWLDKSYEQWKWSWRSIWSLSSVRLSHWLEAETIPQSWSSSYCTSACSQILSLEETMLLCKSNKPSIPIVHANRPSLSLLQQQHDHFPQRWKRRLPNRPEPPRVSDLPLPVPHRSTILWKKRDEEERGGRCNGREGCLGKRG